MAVAAAARESTRVAADERGVTAQADSAGGGEGGERGFATETAAEREGWVGEVAKWAWSRREGALLKRILQPALAQH